MRKELVGQLTLSNGMRRNSLAAIPARRTSAGIADAASGVTQWASTVYRLFSSIRRGSREKRSGRPWPKHDAMPGTLFALVRAFVDSTNPHRGCALRSFCGKALFIDKSRRRILVILREFVGFHRPIFHQINAPRDGVNTPFSGDGRHEAAAVTATKNFGEDLPLGITPSPPAATGEFFALSGYTRSRSTTIFQSN